MDALLIVSGMLLAVLFFLNLQAAADTLCRVICGFGVLLLYNSAAPMLNTPMIGINLITSLIIGVFGLPGGALLLCCVTFLCFP